DTDRLAMASGWTGGWLNLSGTMLTNHKGQDNVTLAGTEAFRVEGAAAAGDGSAGRFVGHRVNGDRVTLAYRVGDADVLEVPGFDPGGPGGGAFTRTICVGPTTRPVTIALCDVAGATAKITSGGDRAALAAGDQSTVVEQDRHAGTGRSELQLSGTRVSLTFPAAPNDQVSRVTLRRGPTAEVEPQAQSRTLPGGGPPAPDRNAMSEPGPARWKPVVTAGRLGDVGAADGAAASKPAAGKRAAAAADPAFVVDTLTLPDANPYHAWMRLGGVDFFPDGRAAVCTLNGDVWVVSGIDATLGKLTWTRFAAGLYEPLGIKVVGTDVYVRGRDQLTRLRDLNGDGEADLYENVSSEGETHPSYHGFVFDLQTDAAGNFYYARGGIGMEPGLGGHGRLIRLSADGKTATTIADGLRAPNGLGVVGPGWVTLSDNQGNWIPSSKIHLLDPNAASPGAPAPFLGFLPHHHQAEVPAQPARPLVWIPHALDNSSGGQCEVPAKSAWGPYAGQWVHTSFGAACTMLLLPDAAAPAGAMPKQAAVVRLPLDFPTGVMRPRFNPADGQLYVAGVGGGWQTKGTADGGLYRVRHTGKPGFAPTRFAVVPGGVRLTFAQPLDKTEAADPQNYAVEQWNYAWTEKYGSPDLSAKTPGKAGHDEVEVTAAELSADNKSVTLKLADLRVVDQLKIQCNLKTAGGAEFEQAVYATVNVVPTGK
ncbi:MAG: large multi-functional protein, partial [Phycisphaerales bacterium]|nr:large multi-functional protein [Phycisphaerales bacterium]